jgi:hypothetical protein
MGKSNAASHNALTFSEVPRRHGAHDRSVESCLDVAFSQRLEAGAGLALTDVDSPRMNPSMSPNQAPSSVTRLDRIALRVLAALLALRVLALFLDPNSLYADETQYWLWAQSLDWGYFSKPPMIAWLIAGATAVFGDADWAVRLPAPFLHTITAVMLGLTAGRLFGPEARAWTMIGWATMPAVWLSSAIISTDAVLMVGVSTGLYALVRLREAPSWPFALLLGQRRATPSCRNTPRSICCWVWG